MEESCLNDFSFCQCVMNSKNIPNFVRNYKNDHYDKNYFPRRFRS